MAGFELKVGKRIQMQVRCLTRRTILHSGFARAGAPLITLDPAAGKGKHWMSASPWIARGHAEWREGIGSM